MQDINFKQLLNMLGFLWRNGPPIQKYILFPLALLAGLSRDWVMIIVNKAAAAPLDIAMHYWLPMFGAAFLAVVGSAFLYHVLATAVTSSVTNQVRLRMLGSLTKVPPGFIDRHQHGAIYHILTTDVSAVSNFTITILNLLPSFVFLCIAVPQLFYYSKIAGFFALLVMLGGTLAYYLQQKALTKLNVDIRQLDVDYFEHVSEMLWGIREIRLNLPRRNAFLSAVSTVLTKVRSLQISAKKIFETGEAATNTFKYALFAGIVFLVPYLVKTEATVTFSLITFVLFSLIPFEQIVSTYLTVIGTLVSYVRIRDLNDQLSSYEAIKENVPAVISSFQSIEFKDVIAVHAFREQSSFILGPINFRLNANEIIFLVGHNGSGKTTFLSVLAGLMDVKSGSLSVDGKLLKPEDMATYRSRVSAIFTTFHVFRSLYGLEKVAEEQGAAAIERVGLTGITEFTKGKVTRVDLSAGQKRRLALATVLLEDRDILILDEFVADQDPGQREYFFRTLLPWLKAQGKTIVVSTHDLHWMDCADRVYSFTEGKMTDITPQKSEAAPLQETA